MTPSSSLVALALLGSLAPAPQEEPIAVPAEPWSVTVLLDAGATVNGCAVGELDAASPGPEIAAVAGDGGVWLARRAGEGWSAERVATLPGEPIGVTVGDVDPRGAGAEIVCVGMALGPEGEGAGALTVVRRTESGWEAERALEEPALLHGVALAGKAATPRELLVTGYTGEVLHVVRRDGWLRAVAVELPAAGKALVATTPSGFAVACTDGALVVASFGRREGVAGWTATVAHRRTAGLARLACDGERVLVADDDGVLSLVSGAGAQEVLRTEGKLRGAVLADLDPATDGLEAATTGYGGRVLVAARAGKGWRARVVHAAAHGFHHLAAAELDGAPGAELVAAGTSGELLLLARPTSSAGERR